MAHQLQLEKKNYRQWVKAGLGLGYLKEGLVPFCNDIADQQHKDILQNIRSTKSLPSNATCGSCQVDTLKPDHKPAGNAGNKVCPLGQVRCSCCFTKGKTACPNKICGAIYDYIVQHHASSPPAPNWKNSDAQQWSTDPWSICQCFINAPGYGQKKSASETDCTGLLHLLINNQYFHSHIACNVTGTNNLFSTVRQFRNDIFHSSSMELEESEANSYIDHMIKVLQDGKELLQRSDAQIAVKKLEDLKEKDFIITTEGFEEILRQIKKEMENAPTKEEYKELKTQMSKLKEEIKRLKEEDSPHQKQLEYEKAKSEWREKLIEQYHKTLLQVPTIPLQPKSEKCSFNEIYIRPQIMKEIKGEKGEIKEVEVKTMSEIFTKNGVPQKSVYVLGDAGSGKTSFCKYLVNCWCLAHCKEHEADNENEEHEGGNEKHGGDNEEHEGDNEEHGGDNEEQRADNEEQRGDNEKHGGDNEEHGGDNEEHGGDYEELVHDNEEQRSEEHGGDNENEGGIENEADNKNEEHEGGNEKHGCESEEHGGDNEKHGGDNDEHVSDNEEHQSDNENEDYNENECYNKNKEHEGRNEKHGRDSEEHGGDNEEHGDDNKKHENDKESEVCRRKYGNDGESEGGNDKNGGDNEEQEKQGDGNESEGGNEKHKEHGSDIINEKVNEKHGGDIENEKHMGNIKKHGGDGDDIQDESDDITISKFNSDDYEYDSKSYELKFNGVKDMKRFNFLFYIPLRQYQNIDSIDEMLQKCYQMKMLNTLLEEESSRVIILLDGLDEWSPENVPKHSIFKEYTIVTTSRPWKFHSLRSSDVEIEQSLKLEGFDFKCESEMVFRTVSQLNVRRHANKEAIYCREKLKEGSLKSFKQVPIMLQQLICLWFDGKLDKTSRCAIYTGMLELFFTWNDMKTTGTSTGLMKGTQKVNLPQYLADKTKLRLNRHLIHEMSQLAFETLFNCPKDKSLSFDICMLDELEISDEVRENCLKLGIITEDECPSLSVSEPPSSLFSFIHKSMQEFLAAVYIGINFNTKLDSSGSTGNVELTKKFIYEVFQKFSTVNDILEQSNVVIMLCGLEPRLATPISKYIYDTVSEDSRVQEYRRTISSDFYMVDSCITDIQKLIIELKEESNAPCSEGSNPVFYIGDLTIDLFNQYCYIVCSSIDQHQILPDSVLSINVHVLDINTKNVRFTKYLPMFHRLEKIVIKLESLSSTQSDGTQSNEQSNEQTIDEINNCVSETIKVNTLTLKSLSLDNVINTDIYYPVCKTVVSNLPSMVNLVAISMSFIAMSHDDTTTFCNFLEGTSHLEQIHLCKVDCQCHNQHDVNLSKHQQLHYLDLKYTVRVIDVDATNLEIFGFGGLKDRNYEKIFDIIKKSYKLKELLLHGDEFSKSHFYHANITERLVSVLPLLHNLSKLQLLYCMITDNIIQLPLEMKGLKDIKLVSVIMSLTTWQKFVDSLPSVPHTVDVSVWFCYITGDGEECNDGMLTLILQRLEGGKRNDAIQYVKDHNQLFHIKRDDRIFLNFSTKT
ncbi:uncharacterized protein LOC132722637 isoform X2 [Ruditapes philippinarum]|uniref:uncharacterized protein LOC132722637 isoform X2 n=1 Tax=Ruditapes philippinarum TaxID=129788 RepID=UPI00295BD5CE|nr:uncharacterized protein LOC132722637 isoform X2 [Ruditapes philippinarum]